MSSIDGVCLDGFSEPVTIHDLRRIRCASNPKGPGICVVSMSSEWQPTFILVSRKHQRLIRRART